MAPGKRLSRENFRALTNNYYIRQHMQTKKQMKKISPLS